MRSLERRMLSEWVREPEGLRVMDAGCGHGAYYLYLAQEGAHLVGVDLRLDPMAMTQKVARALGLKSDFLVGDIAYTGLGEESFDLVICNCALEHMAEDDRALREMRRVLKPRGMLFLTVDCEEKGLGSSLLERLPGWSKRVFLKKEIGQAPCVAEGVRQHLDRSHGIRRRYRRGELVAKLEKIGFQVLDSRYYLTRLGAHLYEILNSFRGLDMGKGMGRWIFGLVSLLSYPLLISLDDISDRKGHGLGVLALRW